MSFIGYTKVSTQDQNLEMQLDAGYPSALFSLIKFTISNSFCKIFIVQSGIYAIYFPSLIDSGKGLLTSST